MKLNCFEFWQKLLNKKELVIDDVVFRLHYKSTAKLLISCGLIIIIREYSDYSIDCISPEVTKYPSDLLNTFCWTQEAFKVIPHHLEINFNNTTHSLDSTQTYQKNYQYINNFHWLGFLLLIQALFFYLPHLLWLSLENNKLKSLVSNINEETLPEEKRDDQKQSLVRYLVKNLHNHELYALQYFSSKTINLINVIIQIAICDSFLNENFLGLGFHLLINKSNHTYDGRSVYSHIFPRSAICHFHKHSTNFEDNLSSIQVQCLLPINLTIEKIFLLLWFWYLSVTLITIFDLMNYLFSYIFVRKRLISLRSESHLCDAELLDSVLRRCKFGDWLLLKIIVKNLNANDFSNVIRDFSKKYAINEPINSEINV